MLSDDSDQKIPIWLFVLIGVGLCAPLCLVLAMVMRPSPPTAAELKVAQQVAEREATVAEQRERDVAKEAAVSEQRERDVAKERAAATAGSPQVKAGGEYVFFDAEHVMRHYNLDAFKLTRIQVWNFGEIDLVDVDHQQNERSGEVRDGKIFAKNADTEIRKPVKIPHLTPGVFGGFANPVQRDGVWIDFGDIQVCFDDSWYMKNRGETGVLADGDSWSADSLKSDQDIKVRVRVADKNAPQEWTTWLCRFREEKPKNAIYDNPSGFLVYKGGILRDEKKVEELEERRASGRVVE